MDAASQHGQKSIDQLIINSPYEEPQEHWKYHRETRLFTREPERRRRDHADGRTKPRAAWPTLAPVRGGPAGDR